MEYQNYDETWESPIEGLSGEELELRAARHVRELRAIRDQLLEACESVVAHLAQSKEFDRLSPEDKLQAEVSLNRKLKAAIAKAKGEVSNA